MEKGLISEEPGSGPMGQDGKNVREIRKTQVDDSAVTVALGRRIKEAAAVKCRIRHADNRS